MKESRQENLARDFQALVARHQAPMYRVAYRLAGNRDDAEDLVQETLVEAFQAFGRFQMGTRFDQWLYRIMTRNYIDKFRRRRRLPSVSLEDVGSAEESQELADIAGDPQGILDRSSYSEPVQEALDRLSPEFRAVVVLCDVQGLSYEEASRVVGSPVGTVRSRLHRAREQLRAWLRPMIRTGEGD